MTMKKHIVMNQEAKKIVFFHPTKKKYRRSNKTHK